MQKNKKCTICQAVKPIDNFHKDNRKDGKYRATCKECANNKSKLYYKNNKHSINIKHKEYNKINKDAIKEYQRDWRSKNPDKIKIYGKTYYDKNRESVIERKSAYISKRWENDYIFRLKSNLRCRLNKAVKNNQKSGSAIVDLGCSIPYLKQHLEAQFQDGMSWENYGKWHIDHIKPLSLFDLEDPEQLKQACHYTNLQPLWAEENIRKGNRYV